MLCLLAYCILFHGSKIDEYPVLCKFYVSVGEKSSTVFCHMLFIVKSTENRGLFLFYCLLSQVKNKSMQYEVCIQVTEKVSALSN